MGRNSSGTYSLPSDTATIQDETPVLAEAHRATYDDIADEITDSLSRSGKGGMTAPFHAANGTEAAPGIAFGSDLDTGIRRSAANQWSGVAGAADIFDVTSAGLSMKAGKALAAEAITFDGTPLEMPLPVALGGTGQATAAAGFDALAPSTTRGDLIVMGASDNGRLPVGAADQILKSDGTDPSWGKIVAANITDAVITFAKMASAAIASVSNMKAGAANVLVTADVVKHAPGVAKAGGAVAAAGAFIGTPFGASAVSRDSTGVFTITLSAAMADTNYFPLASLRIPTSGNDLYCQCEPISTTQFKVYTIDNVTLTNLDFSFVVFGDLA